MQSSPLGRGDSGARPENFSLRSTVGSTKGFDTRDLNEAKTLLDKTGEMTSFGPAKIRSFNLLPVIPDIGRELPVISDLFPDDDILASHLLGVGSFSLQTVHPDLPCSRGAERLDVNRCQLRIAYLFGGAFPH